MCRAGANATTNASLSGGQPGVRCSEPSCPRSRTEKTSERIASGCWEDWETRGNVQSMTSRSVTPLIRRPSQPAIVLMSHSQGAVQSCMLGCKYNHSVSSQFVGAIPCGRPAGRRKAVSLPQIIERIHHSGRPGSSQVARGQAPHSV